MTREDTPKNPHLQALKRATSIGAGAASAALLVTTALAALDAPAAAVPSAQYEARIGVLKVDAAPVETSIDRVSIANYSRSFSGAAPVLSEAQVHEGQSFGGMLAAHAAGVLTGVDPHARIRVFAADLKAPGGNLDSADAKEALGWLRRHGVRVVAMSSEDMTKTGFDKLVAQAQASDMLVVKGRTGDEGLARAALVASYSFARVPETSIAKFTSNVGPLISDHLAPPSRARADAAPIRTPAQVAAMHEAGASLTSASISKRLSDIAKARPGLPESQLAGASLADPELSRRLSSAALDTNDIDRARVAGRSLGSREMSAQLSAIAVAEQKKVEIASTDRREARVTEPKPVIVHLAERQVIVTHVEGLPVFGPSGKATPAAAPVHLAGLAADKGKGR